MNFEYFNWREKKAQSFDKENITLTKAGKTYNVYDKIQEAREDTEIYPTLEKYGCIDRIMLNTQGVYDDFTKYNDLRGLKEQQELAKNMFYNLPLETRQKFNNDMNIFLKDGEKYIKNLLDEEKAKQAQQTVIEQPVKSETIKTETVNNG